MPQTRGKPKRWLLRTLGHRVYFYMFVMFPPLLGVAITGIYLIHHNTTLMADVVDEIVVEVHSVMHVQVNLATVSAHLHKYAKSPSPANRRELTTIVAKSSHSIAELPFERFHDARERESLGIAVAGWHDAAAAIKMILAQDIPSEEIVGRVDDRIRASLDALLIIHDVVHEEISEEQAFQARTALWSISIMGVLALIGIAVAAFGATVLIRTILRPLASLRQGASVFGRGDLAHRIEPLADPEMQQVADAFNQMADSIKDKEDRLQELSIRDGLTGALNRREFSRRLELEIDRAERYGTPLSFLLLDIDRFKDVNDIYGHQAGDHVLLSLCQRIQCALRSSDLLARYGGEEFGVILPNTDAGHGTILAERLRKLVEAEPFAFEDAAIGLTVSIGVSELVPETDDIESLIKAADDAMYEAKGAGRNQVRVHEELSVSGAG